MIFSQDMSARGGETRENKIWRATSLTLFHFIYTSRWNAICYSVRLRSESFPKRKSFSFSLVTRTLSCFTSAPALDISYNAIASFRWIYDCYCFSVVAIARMEDIFRRTVVFYLELDERGPRIFQITNKLPLLINDARCSRCLRQSSNQRDRASILVLLDCHIRRVSDEENSLDVLRLSR